MYATACNWQLAAYILLLCVHHTMCIAYRVAMRCSLEQYVKLDSAAAEAVTLLPDPTFVGANASIYAVLNRCKTKVRVILVPPCRHIMATDC